MDREALEHSLVRRLIDHIEHGTTDMAPDVLEVAADTYTSVERLAAEQEVLFHEHPLVLCLSGALPEPGSYLTVDLLDTPVLVTRDRDGSPRAFHDTCRHRGSALCTAPHGRFPGARITCPYHAWSYALSGELVATPKMALPADFRREDHSLYAVAIEAWARRNRLADRVKVTDGRFVYVALGDDGQKRAVPKA